MITVILNVLLALLVGVGLTMADISPWYWSILWGILVLVGGQLLLGWVLRRRMAGTTELIQTIMKQGQAKMQAKIQMWRNRQMSNPKAAEAELAKDRDAMITAVQQVLQPLEKYRLWIPLLGRQLATMELQFAWQKKDFKRVDKLLPTALLMDPMLVCMKLARMFQKDESTEAMTKVFRKAVRRARYGTTALLYSVMAWVLVRREDPDGAYKLLLEADEKNENAVVKSNKQVLMNNKLNHFSNAAFGDEWYALWLEEPRARVQRMQHVKPGRYFN